MKKIFLALALIIVLSPAVSFAQSPTPSESAKSESQEKADINSIDKIKDKVASRVAELKLVEKRGVVGVVESVDGTQIRVNDLNDKTRIIDVDELTKFSSSDDTSYDISDIKKGSKISAIGLYNKESQHLLARFVNEISIPLFLNGVISEKDDKEFTITLSTEDEKKYTVDVEKITKSFSYSDGELETTGFTKIEPMQNALVIGYPDPKEKDRITASRIIVFPDIPKNPRIEIENTPSEKPTKIISPAPTP